MKIKQIGIVLLFLIPLITTVIISCNKQTLTIDTNIKAGVKIQDGRYVFANREIFESYVNELGKLSDQQLEDLEKKVNFKSRRAIQEELRKNAELNQVNLLSTQSIGLKINSVELIEQNEELYYIEDPGFASVLNEQYIIQVDDEIFNINIVDGYVYVLDVENQQYLPQLEDAYLEPNTIYRYEMGLPVLDILAETGNGGDPCLVDPSFCPTTSATYGPEQGALCSQGQSFENGVCNGCAGTGHKKVDDNRTYYINSLGLDKHKWESKIAYQPLGIWFSIISKIEHRVSAPFDGGSNYDPNKPEDPSNFGGTVAGDSKSPIKMLNNSEYNFRKRCRNREVGMINEDNGYSGRDKKEYRFYSGTRCLKDYCITARFGIYEYQGRMIGGISIFKSIPTEWTLTLKSY
jgi:hypothetical protein